MTGGELTFIKELILGPFGALVCMCSGALMFFRLFESSNKQLMQSLQEQIKMQANEAQACAQRYNLLDQRHTNLEEHNRKLQDQNNLLDQRHTEHNRKLQDQITQITLQITSLVKAA